MVYLGGCRASSTQEGLRNTRTSTADVLRACPDVKQAAVLLLLAPDAPAVDLGEDAGDMTEEEQRRQVVASLVGEIVLCVKEVNQKTRAAAYALLVGLGQAMQDAQPPPIPDLDAHMAGMELKGEVPHGCRADVSRGRPFCCRRIGKRECAA